MEQLAWDLVKHLYQEFLDEVFDRRTLFKLFCLFNRFCDPDSIPMKLTHKAGGHLFLKLGVDVSRLPSRELVFHQFLSSVRQDFHPDHMNKLYNQIVRNVIIQDRLKIRHFQDGGVVYPTNQLELACDGRRACFYIYGRWSLLLNFFNYLEL